MARTEDTACVPLGELIRDMGRQNIVLGGTLTSEEQLMQRSGDPLLVREFLVRQSCSAPDQISRQSLTGDAAIALANAYGGAFRCPSLSQVSARYCHPDPFREDSCRLSPFEPSVRDRESAMEFGRRQRIAAVQSTPSIGRFAAAAGLAFLAALLLAVLHIVSG